ncbi:Zinc metalloproteinase nas-4 [Trichuris trichiura]|uniref:Metalloendopeptidase n=1 Tax=Trichuris trichiura TaxID=36087 RepID=A0A077ZJF1_TRITR|nr:Zinc metalloproteinase nas-4 [Trichuris trichiura]
MQIVCQKQAVILGSKLENLNETKRHKATLTAGDVAGYSPLINRGDIRKSSLAKGASRSAVRELEYRWPGGEIPYIISEQYNSEYRKIITGAMDEIQEKTCLRFIPRESQKQQDYLYIEPVDGCYSFIGRIGGAQQVSLADECMEHGVIVHELMHATGFIHEHNRSDRDRYVKVLWKNVISGMETEFAKQSDQIYDTLGFPYDYNSVMHYELTAFSRNGKPVMELLKPSYGEVGQRGGLSASDVQKINRLYNCRKQTTALYTRKEEGNELPAISPEVCEDLSGHCAEWLQRGFCISVSHRAYTAKICRKSCNFC